MQSLAHMELQELRHGALDRGEVGRLWGRPENVAEAPAKGLGSGSLTIIRRRSVLVSKLLRTGYWVTNSNYKHR